MKKLMIFLFLLIPASFMVSEAREAHAYACSSSYGCPECSWTSPLPGKCQTHNIELIPDGMYYCKSDPGTVTNSPGKCTRCGNALIQMNTQHLVPASYSLAMTQQDTTKKLEQHSGKAVRDHDLEEQMNNDPDNRDRSIPKTHVERDSANVPEP